MDNNTISTYFQPLLTWVAEKFPNNHAKLMVVSKLQEAVWWSTKSIAEDEHNVPRKAKRKKTK